MSFEKIDNRRKYTLDIEPFITDSHAKYYWLGFLSADGSVGKSEPRIRVEINQQDEDIIYKLANFCKSNAPITKRINNKGTNCIGFSINSSKLKKYLANYNIVPNKTPIFKMPLDKIPDDFLWDYVRGLFDGDGCLTILNHQKYNPYGISFVSANKECVEQMRMIWGVENLKISENNGAYIIQKYGKECLEILDKMYKNSTEDIRLNRKYERYRSLIM